MRLSQVGSFIPLIPLLLCCCNVPRGGISEFAARIKPHALDP